MSTLGSLPSQPTPHALLIAWGHFAQSLAPRPAMTTVVTSVPLGHLGRIRTRLVE